MGLSQSTEEATTSQNHERRKPVAPPRIRKSSVFLRGCETDEEHKLRKRMMIEVLRPLKGEDGLDACGLEYRLVTIREDGKLVEGSLQSQSNLSPVMEDGDMSEFHHDEEKKEESALNCTSPPRPSQRNEKEPIAPKHMRMTRLFHRESNTMITSTNRKEFIADGAMYDIVSRLATEYAQEVMIREGQLEWVTIDDDESPKEPIRALVSSRLVEDESRLDSEPTLLIVTGKGHVRAGVFSRQHLLISGLECSSAVEFVREARQRNMNLMVLDPNVHGDRFAMTTFEKSMAHLFRRWENNGENKVPVEQIPQNLFVLSHSQSGAQFERYLLDKAECYLPHMCAIAFTDSTHNIQWAKRKNQQALENLLESEMCVYFKRTDKIVDFILKPFSSLGQVVDTDEFWEHRFGKIKTLCAGTSEHSLTNWFARNCIWEHFDRFLTASNS